MGGGKPYGGSWGTGSVPTAALPRGAARASSLASIADGHVAPESSPDPHQELSVSAARLMGCALSSYINQYKKMYKCLR